jgi:hypothetical protein
MPKHKLIELRKIIEERIGSLTEEVEIATNAKLNPLYIADRKDEIGFACWTVTIIDSILNRDNEHKQVQLGTLDSILGQLFDLKYGENGRAIEIAEANKDFRRAIRLRKQLNRIQDLEDEITTQIKN